MPLRGTRWPCRAESLVNAGNADGLHFHGNHASRKCFLSTINAALERPAQDLAPKDTRSSLWSRNTPRTGQGHKEPNVDPNSLRNTLEAHREANRASLIVKIAGKGSDRQPIEIPSLVRREEQLVKSQDTAGARHIKLPRDYKGVTRSHGRRKKTRSRRVLHASEEFIAQWAPKTELTYREKYPWMRHMTVRVQGEVERSLAGTEQLNREIDAFYSYSQPTPRERKAADQALQDLSGVIKKVDQNIEVNVIGSRATGLALPMSDIDLNISTSSSSNNSQATKTLLTKLARHLMVTGRKQGLFRGVTTRFLSKIPLVTGRHALTHLEFQVQSTVDVFLSMQQTMSFINEFPTLQKLFVLLKQMLTMRGLNLGSEQGLSSYPLLVMIVAALKFSDGKLDRRDAGAHLRFFLDIYSEIDFTTTAISFSPLQYVLKRHPHSSTLPHTSSAAPAPDSVLLNREDTEHEAKGMDARRRFATIKPDAEFLMCLQDPANLQNDLGKAAYRIGEIQTVITRFKEDLKAGLKAWDEAEGNDEQAPLLGSCIGGDYHIYEHMKHDLASSIGRLS